MCNLSRQAKESTKLSNNMALQHIDMVQKEGNNRGKNSRQKSAFCTGTPPNQKKREATQKKKSLHKQVQKPNKTKEKATNKTNFRKYLKQLQTKPTQFFIY